MSVIVRREGGTRLEAERRMLKLYGDEYTRLARTRGHVEAVRSLVKRHKNRYNNLVRELRDGHEVAQPATRPAAATTAA
jgi:hypothetical protein